MPTTYIHIITDLGDIDRLHFATQGFIFTAPQYYPSNSHNRYITNTIIVLVAIITQAIGFLLGMRSQLTVFRSSGGVWDWEIGGLGDWRKNIDIRKTPNSSGVAAPNSQLPTPN